MLFTVRETISEFNMLRNGDKIVIAVSGGPDSMALLHIFRNLQTEYKLELVVAHINHMFRGAEADDDAAFVAAVCKDWHIPCFITRINVPAIMAERGLSAQAAAREVRYHFFKHVAAITGSNKIAVGHNADDQAETIIMRFLRGTGPEGLTGIPAVRSGIIRPLMGVFRTEVEQYCRTWGIEAREDASNKKMIYMRNRIRNDLIPHLENKYNKQLRRNLLILGEILQSEEVYWANIIEQEFGKTVIWKENAPYIQIEQFGQLAKAVQRRVLRNLFQQMGVANTGFIHVEEVRSLLTRGTVGDCIELPGKWRTVRHYTYVILEKEQPMLPVQGLYTPVFLEIPGKVRLPGLNMAVETTLLSATAANPTVKITGLFDWERLCKPLYIRTRQPGDQFFHTGIGHRKKLKEYFIDRKIPRAQRDKVLLVIHGDDILWIVGYYTDERYLADDKTRTALHIELREE
jgi:tRNA(Ile)-lysidine synthase